jgi:hypothetical protein
MDSAMQISNAIFACCGLASFTAVALAFYRTARRAADAL